MLLLRQGRVLNRKGVRKDDGDEEKEPIDTNADVYVDYDQQSEDAWANGGVAAASETSPLLDTPKIN